MKREVLFSVFTTDSWVGLGALGNVHVEETVNVHRALGSFLFKKTP